MHRYYSNLRAENILDPDGEKFQAGWIIYHDDIDPLDVAQGVEALGSKYRPGSISNGSEHTDKVHLGATRRHLSFTLILRLGYIIYQEIRLEPPLA